MEMEMKNEDGERREFGEEKRKEGLTGDERKNNKILNIPLHVYIYIVILASL